MNADFLNLDTAKNYALIIVPSFSEYKWLNIARTLKESIIYTVIVFSRAKNYFLTNFVPIKKRQHKL